MKLRNLSVGMVGAISAGLAFIAVALWQISVSFATVATALDHRQKTMTLTDDFSKMTALLTQLVRLYAVTGDEKYLMIYYDLAAYRNGTKKMSADRGWGYWEKALVDRANYHSVEEDGLSFPARLERAGFVAAEMDRFRAALAIAQTLHEIEQAPSPRPRGSTIRTAANSSRMASRTGITRSPWFMRTTMAGCRGN